MDLTKLLEADHRRVEDLFARIEEADDDERRPLVDELVAALQAHMELEEAVVYPGMASVVGDEAVEEAENEHLVGREGLTSMLELVGEPGFGAALDSTKAGIAHHVDEEENEVFPRLRKDGSVLGEMATPFMTRRLELGLPVDAEALAAASTKDELIEEARSAGVEVKSSMTKADLAGALSDVMAGMRS
jgi:hypothetical protein